ncbi:YecH family metal-binding protein [Vibrio sp. M260118]|uniref:YecH family metal-binding protein n=1 Tax=Vibrio sp. M260118 TaxID=3020896 RepID=UPI002F3FC518
MTTETHAHKVLNLLRERPMTKPELESAVNELFGEQARFRTCKCNGFTLETLLEFFIEREKVIVKDGVWQVNAERVCGH